jgi:hypothetical protein
MGPHAGETELGIFGRKIADINRIGKTFWLNRSYKSKPNMIQQICAEAKKEKNNCYCLFIAPSSEGGADPAITSDSATSYSEDALIWNSLPSRLSPVTGKIDRGARALVFDQLELINKISFINLWDYADFFNQELPIKIMQGGSTFCALKRDMRNHKNRIVSYRRRIAAVGRMSEPYCVHLK